MGLTLNDDGKGFDTSKPLVNGIGLTNIKNRAKITGAELSLESEINSGTLLNIILKKKA